MLGVSTIGLPLLFAEYFTWKYCDVPGIPCDPVGPVSPFGPVAPVAPAFAFVTPNTFFTTILPIFTSKVHPPESLVRAVHLTPSAPSTANVPPTATKFCNTKLTSALPLYATTFVVAFTSSPDNGFPAESQAIVCVSLVSSTVQASAPGLPSAPVLPSGPVIPSANFAIVNESERFISPSQTHRKDLTFSPFGNKVRLPGATE